MVFEAKEITLKNGQLCTIKSPTQEDAEAMLSYLKQVCDESEFMGRYADEINLSVDEEKAFISAIISDPRRIMISAYIWQELVAYGGFDAVSPHERAKHRAGLGMAIKKEYWGLGIGTAILKALVESAKSAEYEQLELEVITENDRALALYKKLDFTIYGTHEDSFKYRDGRYRASHLMRKKL